MSVKKLQEQDDIVSDVKEIITLIEGREWAEHCTKSTIGKKLEFLITEMHGEMATLQQKLDAMAAENAALKQVAMDYANLADSRLSEMTANCESDCRRECYELTNNLPATDAYLNSVRAEAVSNFWNSSLRDVAHVLKDIRAFDDSSEAAGIVHSEIKERVDDFVESLRSGTHDTADKAG